MLGESPSPASDTKNFAFTANMSFARFFGEGPVFTWDGTSTAIDLTALVGTNLDIAVQPGGHGTAVIHFIEDSTFSVLTFNYPGTGSASVAAKTFKAGTEIVGVTKYTLATGSCIAYHSK